MRRLAPVAPRCSQAEGGAPCTPGAPVVYNKENALNPYFIVYGKRVVPAPKKGAKAAGGGGQ